MIRAIKKIKVMTEYEYLENQKFQKFEILVNTKEYITKDEFDFIVAYDETERINFSYIGDSNGDYLNLNVYSEHDHEKRQYEMEIG